MDRRISTLHLTPEQTKEIQPYLDARAKGIGCVFMIISSSADPGLGRSVVKSEVAYLPWGEAIKVVNVLRKIFGLNPILHRAKKKYADTTKVDA